MRQFNIGETFTLPSGEVGIVSASKTDNYVAFRYLEGVNAYDVMFYPDFAALVDAGADKARIQAAIDMCLLALEDTYNSVVDLRASEILKILDPEKYNDE